MDIFAYRCMVVALIVLVIQSALRVVQAFTLLFFFAPQMGFEIDLVYAASWSIIWFLFSLVALIWVPKLAKHYLRGAV